MAKCPCNLIINELLTYVQNKIDVMDKQSLVLICIHSFNSSEIQAAKDLLMKTLSDKPTNLRRCDGNQRNMEDIIRLMKTADPNDIPTFVARDLSKLPPIINTSPAGESHREDGRGKRDNRRQNYLGNNWKPTKTTNYPVDTSKLKAVGQKNLIKKTKPSMVRVPQEPLTEKMEKSVKCAIERYIMNDDAEELYADVITYHLRFHSAVIAMIVDITCNKNAKEVPIISKALVHLVATNIISIHNFLSGLKDSFELAPNTYIEGTMVYCNLGMIVAPHIVKNHITFSQIFNLSNDIIRENQGNLLLKAIISNMCDNMGATFVTIKWLESGMELSQWMEENQVSKWIVENKFHFLVGHNAGTDEIKGKLTPEERSKLLQLMRADEDCKSFQGWIEEFKGIPKELTPQKFDTLLKKVEALSIDNEKRLRGLIDLIFEKAIEEPNFSEAYAAMCSKLCKIKVPAENATNPEHRVNCRALIINKCQHLFQTNWTDEQVLKLEKEIKACTDPNKMKELLVKLQEENRRVRMRSVGNVRFIGELYKLKMLTLKLMLYCTNYLIENHEEDKLECLCDLLTTIGQQIENAGPTQLDLIFKKMLEITKVSKISSRVRFMILDVIELRKRRWVKKGVVDLQPKTMDQIKKEAELQHGRNEVGVTLVALTSFFNSIKEENEDDSCSED